VFSEMIADQRDYSILKFMCDHFNISELRLMTNNPAKLKAIEELGINLSERVPHKIAACTQNSNYLSFKSLALIMSHLSKESCNESI
jgi:GTP cyclohydrolase II